MREAAGEHLVARLGGDEFVILVEGTDGVDEVVDVAEAALAAVRQPIRVGGHEFTVTASGGIVERPASATTPGDLMRAADITLHWAKSAGRARWMIFDAERNKRELARHALSAAMPAALERGEFYLDYQPLASLYDGAVLGVEALVRWRHPDLGVLRPDSFIGLAEETGLIVRLGEWVMAEACREAGNWSGPDGRSPFVSVNLAVRQVHAAGLVDQVRALLEQTGLPPQRLQLEITESTMMSSAAEPVHALRVLADLGVRIAIDDFGTGYSNLAYLRHLPVNELKLAGSFVTGLGNGGSRYRRADPGLAGLPGARPGPDRDRRGSGDRGAGGAAAGDRLRRRPGLALRPARPTAAHRGAAALPGLTGRRATSATNHPDRADHPGSHPASSAAIRSACSSQRHSRSTQARPAAPSWWARSRSSSRPTIRSVSRPRSRPGTT